MTRNCTALWLWLWLLLMMMSDSYDGTVADGDKCPAEVSATGSPATASEHDA